MHLAASEGQHLIIQALVEGGANVGVVDRWGNSPLGDSVREGHLQVSNMLVSHGARLDASSGYTESRASAELCDLAKAGNLERIKQLAACGVDLNSADYDQRCSLHIAASEGHKHIVEDFLARPEVDCTVTDRWGGEPTAVARLELLYACCCSCFCCCAWCPSAQTPLNLRVNSVRLAPLDLNTRYPD